MQRINELDFLKGFLIILVISFHLVYIGDTHPYAKQIVYTFHMPGFLLISGYLINVNKRWKDFLKTMLHYAIPYLVIESGYILMASVLPIREHLDNLTTGVFFESLLLHPLGPYWYLQTLIICGLSYAVISRLDFMKPVSRFILLGIVYYLISTFGVLSFGCSMYFLAGAVLRHSNVSFTSLFQASPLAIVAFALLAIHPQNLSLEQSGGILMMYLGQKSMPLFLFSPISHHLHLGQPCRGMASQQNRPLPLLLREIILVGNHFFAVDDPDGFRRALSVPLPTIQIVDSLAIGQ